MINNERAELTRDYSAPSANLPRHLSDVPLLKNAIASLLLDEGFLVATAGSDEERGRENYFGGDLYWASSDGKRTKLLYKMKVRWWHREQGKVFVLGATPASLGNQGVLHTFDEKSMRSLSQVEIRETPFTALLDGSVVTVVTESGAFELRDGHRADLVDRRHWMELRPNSVARKDDIVYIGAQAVVIELQKVGTTWHEDWLVHRSLPSHGCTHTSAHTQWTPNRSPDLYEAGGG